MVVRRELWAVKRKRRTKNIWVAFAFFSSKMGRTDVLILGAGAG